MRKRQKLAGRSYGERAHLGSPTDADYWDRFIGPIVEIVSPIVQRELRDSLREADQSDDWRDKWAAIGALVMAYHSGFLHMGVVSPLAADALRLWTQLEADRAFQDEFSSKTNRKMFDEVGHELTEYRYGGQPPIGPAIFDHLRDA